jgi:predicted dehydrogenase
VSEKLRAVVLGSGYAGEGHTLALRDAGVEVVGMASRTAAAVEAAAARLGIPEAGTDWRGMIADLRPDIVAVGTPGGAHLEMASVAIEAGCHVLCDKPLATNAADARTLYRLAKARGVKTAYAASFRHQPQTLYARQLVQEGVLGNVWEVECVSHYHWPTTMPFGWPHRLDQGGGRLNNNFTHKLAIVQNITGGEVLAAMGETRNDLKRAPVAQQVHDFRNYLTQALTPEEAAAAAWADVDSDWAYTVLVRLGARTAGLGQAVSALFRHSGLRFGKNADYVAVYGSAGTLHIEGAYTQGAMYLRNDGPEWAQIEPPEAILAALPDEADHSQRNWNQLAREFAADIRGAGTSDYQTFREGWIYQEVIDAVRRGDGWTTIPDDV